MNFQKIFNMEFIKINSYTRVLAKDKCCVNKYTSILNEKSLAKSSNFLKEKKNRNPTDQFKIYTKFINEVFKDRIFISQREFNKLVQASFNSSPTWYRRRMRDLKLITEENKLIKKIDHEKGG